MPESGQFVLNPEGQFLLNPDGSWALFDASGQCEPCCGPGGGATSFCITQNSGPNGWYPSRSYLCDSVLWTIPARNSWSDDFAYPTSVPPCDNYARPFSYLTGGWNSTGPLGLPSPPGLTPNLLRTGLATTGYSAFLWNGGGTSLHMRVAVDALMAYANTFSFTDRPGGHGFNAYAVYNPSTPTSVGSINVSLNGGYQYLVNNGPSTQVATGVFSARGDRLEIESQIQAVRINPTQVELGVSATYRINASTFSYSWTQGPITFAEPLMPDFCYGSFMLRGGFPPMNTAVWDNFTGSIINPRDPL